MTGNNYGDAGDDDGHDSDDDDSDGVVVVVVVTAVVDVSLVSVLQKCPRGSSCQVINRRPRCVTTGSLFILRSSETHSLFCMSVLSVCMSVLSVYMSVLSVCMSVLSVCLYSVCLYSLSACLYSMSACLYSLSACLYSACLYSMSACLYSLSACRPLCLSAPPSPYLSFLKLLLVCGCCFSLGLVVRHVLSLLLVLLLFVIFPASSPLADELISCTVLTYT